MTLKWIGGTAGYGKPIPGLSLSPLPGPALVPGTGNPDSLKSTEEFLAGPLTSPAGAFCSELALNSVQLACGGLLQGSPESDLTLPAVILSYGTSSE